MSRGGARLRTGPQVNNSSGLIGIVFRRRPSQSGPGQPEVCVCVGEQRITRSLGRRSPRAVLREVLRLRRDAGLATDSLRQALDAYEEWSARC